MPGTDYELSYTNNKNVGKASVIITVIGSYNGKIIKSFGFQKAVNKITKVTVKKKGKFAKL